MSALEDRPLRADAVRNRARILDAAREQITVGGEGVGMVEIARAAGVAVGTLYRHFPTKSDLVAAVLGAYTAQVADEAERVAGAVGRGERPARDALVDFLAFVLDASAVNHAVKAVAQSLGTTVAGDPNETRAAQALGTVLAAGQADGAVRAGVSVADLYLLIASAPMDQPKAERDRWLELIRPGLLA